MTDRIEVEELPPHEVFEKIEEGLLAIVYRARDVTRNRFVALKILRGDKLPPEATWRFFREALAAAQLHHPHVLPILRVGLLDSQPCYTMPLAPHGSLLARREQFRDPRAAAGLIEKLSRAVAAAHAHGMLHGGLEPKEILFDEYNQPLVGGFGLVPIFHSIERNMGAPVPGNGAYFAPEQFGTPPGPTEAATDVWALGVILYELLTGRQPFTGTTAIDSVRRILHDAPVPPRRLHRDMDRELEAVVLHCLQKGPDDRYPSARALAEDLERWLRAEPTVARPESWLARFARGFRRAAP